MCFKGIKNVSVNTKALSGNLFYNKNERQNVDYIAWKDGACIRNVGKNQTSHFISCPKLYQRDVCHEAEMLSFWGLG